MTTEVITFILISISLLLDFYLLRKVVQLSTKNDILDMKIINILEHDRQVLEKCSEIIVHDGMINEQLTSILEELKPTVISTPDYPIIFTAEAKDS